MDELSLQGKPYFFMIDFLKENIEIYDNQELEDSGLLIDFENVKSFYANGKSEKELYLSSFPNSQDEYEVGFKKVQSELKKGNSYLVNYTQRTRIESNFSLEDFFYHSKAKYKVCKPNHFVFFSPETFIKIVDNKIFTYPMKGTIDASIENAAEKLKNDIKEKAEHYTVVDLLRNDLSMIADNVTVTDFQRIDLIKTKQKDLFAMSSEILGEIKTEFKQKIGSILDLLLPAGSILGAPKPKTLEIIKYAENYERAWYTGICGWFDGENLDSCVMIRFIEKDGENLYFKSGGGITHMSRLQDEYEELKNKIYAPIY